MFHILRFVVGLVAVAAFLRCSPASADFACASTSASSARLFAALFCRNCLNVIMVVSFAVTQVFMGFDDASFKIELMMKYELSHLTA